VYDNTSKNLVGSATVDAGGNWSLTGLSLKSSGSNAFMAVQVDAAGNTSAVSNSHTIAVDVDQSVNGNFNNTTTLSFTNVGFTVLRQHRQPDHCRHRHLHAVQQRL